MKNKAANGGEVAGLLLYARTSDAVQPIQIFKMSGNTIGVKTLNLNCKFEEIKEQLNSIIYEFIK